MESGTFYSMKLNGEWQLKAVGKHLKGVELAGSVLKGYVPGTVHTDLMANGIIPDPFYRDNELKVQWVEDLDWEYTKEFELDKGQVSHPIIYLVFEGLDTVADVFLNNRKVLHAQNMFVKYKLRIEKFVREGKNSLRVLFHSPKSFAIKREKKHGKVFAELDSYRVHIRKAQYSFGWDWGPRLATSGIWKDVHIDFVDDMFIESFRLSTLSAANGTVNALFVGKFQAIPGTRTIGKNIHVEISDKQGSHVYVFLFAKSVHEQIRLRGIVPWWTHDVGEPKLYDVNINVTDEKEGLIASQKFKTGFRTIQLLRERDNIGESFIFKLNGKKLFVRGADWIPSDSFLPRVKSSDYATLIKAAREAGMNMLRVWGGGIYEDENFYKACDENGILVWQDFMFACASYPEYEEFLEEVENEAIQNVNRISNHPCLALFCGNNEAEWIWQTKTGRHFDEMPGSIIFDKKLREVVRKTAPEINYWRSSPFGGKNPNSQTEGNHHQWEVWSGFKSFGEYRKNTARFVTEFGFQAPPSLATINAFTEAGDRDIQSRIMRLHNKQTEGTERLFRFLAGEVRIAKDFDDIILQMQLVQAKAIKTGVEHWRKRKWKTAGTIFWQLNDCWPVTSWAAIDYFKKPKALYYWAKKFYKPVKLVIDKKGDDIRVHIVNDTFKPVSVGLSIFLMNVQGDVLRNFGKDSVLKPNSVTLVQKFPLSGFQKEEVLTYAQIKNLNTGDLIDEEDHIFVSWLDFRFEIPHIEVTVVKEERSRVIKLKSDRFVQGTVLQLDETVGELSDNYFTLIPGIEKVVLYNGTQDIDRLQVRLPLLSEVEIR